MGSSWYPPSVSTIDQEGGVLAPYTNHISTARARINRAIENDVFDARQFLVENSRLDFQAGDSHAGPYLTLR
jgi:hypothetical protein